MSLKYGAARINKRDLIGYFYVLPWIIGLAVFQLYPFISSLIFSFTDKSMADVTDFVGWKNYIYMFTKDADFYQVLKVTILYVIMAVPGRVTFALIVAVLLNAELKGINFYRTVYYLPSIFGGSVAISVVWRFLFQKQGAINGLLELFSIEPVSWLGDPKIALLTVCIIPVWQFGSSMVLFLAALKNVPKDLYEASKIDGSSRIHTFFRITIPMISPIVLFNLVMQSVGCFQEFSTAFVLTNGGPNNATYLYGIKLYREAFTSFKMGYASSLSWFMFIVILLFTLGIFASCRYWIFYNDGGES